MIILTTKNLIISTPCIDDFHAIHDFELRNQTHLKKWESINPCEEELKHRLNAWIVECKEGKSARFVIKLKDNAKKIIGLCNFTQIFYGAFQACYLGYKIDREYEGKGWMFEALECSIAYIFNTLGLHRIMANYMPTNSRSAKLLNHLGFKVEGFAKNYLLINHRWEDHVLTALSKEKWLEIAKQKTVKEKLVSPNVSFRQVQMSDAAALVLLMDQLGYSIEENLIRENIAHYFSLKNQKAWIAKVSDQVVGCIAVAITRSFHQPTSFLRVIALVVDIHQRRTGIGKSLLNIAEQFALKNGCSHIELTSGMHRAKLGTHDFYLSLGYTELNSIKKYFFKKI